MTKQKKISNTNLGVSEETKSEIELEKIRMELDNTTPPKKNVIVSDMDEAPLILIEKKVVQPLMVANENTTLEEKSVEQKSFGRPKKEAAIGRKAFTTSLDPSLSHKLKQKALDREITTADLLNQILKEQLENY